MPATGPARQFYVPPDATVVFDPVLDEYGDVLIPKSIMCSAPCYDLTMAERMVRSSHWASVLCGMGPKAETWRILPKRRKRRNNSCGRWISNIQCTCAGGMLTPHVARGRYDGHCAGCHGIFEEPTDDHTPRHTHRRHHRSIRHGVSACAASFRCGVGWNADRDRPGTGARQWRCRVWWRSRR